MKFLVIFSSLIIGLLYGLIGGLNKSKPTWWKIVSLIVVTVSLFLTLAPPVAEDAEYLSYLGAAGFDSPMNVELNINPTTNKWIDTLQMTEIGVNTNEKLTFPILFKGKTLPVELTTPNIVIVKVHFDKIAKVYHYVSTISVNPWLVYPFIPELEHKVKILNLHVACAWIAVLAFLISMIFSIGFLKSKDFNYDIKASSSALIGIVFTLLATFTGMIWAKSNWGSYWNWDPRETSIFILLLIYFAYFALRSAIDKEELKARLSSVYSILSFITVPFLVFILPRITSGLHPGSSGDGNAGPILSTKGSMLNPSLLITFGLSIMVFTILYFWMLNIQVRFKKVQHKFENISE